MKKIVALALVLCVLLACAGTAMAAASGTCGENLAWALDDAGTLTISGSGAMHNYWVGDSSPWEGDNRIKAVVIESGVTSIGSFALRDCGVLTNVTIADTVTSIGDSAFANAGALNTVTFTGDSQLSSIDSQAFFRCKALTSITLPASVNSLEYDAFTHCDNLEAIYIADDGAAYKSVDGVVYSADGKTLRIYPKGKKDTTYVIPDGVTEIGMRAFIYNSHLVNITIPECMTMIGEGAFWYCRNLEKVVFDGSGQLTTIGDSAFGACEALTTVNADCNWDGSLYNFGEGVNVEIAGHTPAYAAENNKLTELCSVCDSKLGTATITAASGVYNGGPYTAEVNATGTLEGQTFGITYTRDGKETNETPAQAGSYTASITKDGVTASVDFEIAKAESAVTAAPTANALTYTGSQQALVTEGEGVGGTLVYSQNQKAWSDKIPTGSAAGEYTVYYKVQGDSNHNDSGVCGPIHVTIDYLSDEQAPDALPTGDRYETGCYTEQPTLNAQEGTEVSLSDDPDGHWAESLPLPTEDGTHTYTYYVKMKDGTIAKKSVTLTVDTTAPEVQEPTVLVDPTTAEITVTAADEVSGVMGVWLEVNSGKGEWQIEGNGDGSYILSGLTPGETYGLTLIVRDYMGHETKVDITITTPQLPALPQTGDHSRTALWLMMLSMAGAGMMLLRRKAEQD